MKSNTEKKKRGHAWTKNVCSPFQQLLQFKAPAQARAIVLSAVRERTPTSLHRAQLTCRTVHSWGSVRSPRNGPQGGTQHLADVRRQRFSAGGFSGDVPDIAETVLRRCKGEERKEHQKDDTLLSLPSFCSGSEGDARTNRPACGLAARLLLGRRGGYPDPLRRYYL